MSSLFHLLPDLAIEMILPSPPAIELESAVKGNQMSLVTSTAIWDRVSPLPVNSNKEDLTMKRFLTLAIASLFMATVAVAAEPKDYQVTGPVLDVNEDVVIVQKGNEKWEIGRDKGTKIKGGDLKKGSRVTVHYKIKASSIDVKDGGDAKTGTKAKADDKKATSKTK
jgi:hypothetical protein